MGLAQKDISLREIAALYYHVFGDINDFQELYKIAYNDKIQNINYSNLSDIASKWKRSTKVKNYIDYLQEKKLEYKQKLKKEILKELEQEKEKENIKQLNEDSEHLKELEQFEARKNIDYSNPKERQRQYNKIIARSDNDPKTQLDALKMFETIQREDKQAAKEGKSVRVYMPLSCDICPLYEKAKRKKG